MKINTILAEPRTTFFINDLDEDSERTLRQFADGTELGGGVDTLVTLCWIPRDLDRLEGWAQRNLMEFNLQVQGPAPGEEQPQAPVKAGADLLGAALWRGTGSAGGREGDHEPAVCPGCQEGQWDPGVH